MSEVDTKKMTALVFEHQTFGRTDDPKNMPIATFDYEANTSFELPVAVSWENRIFLNENLSGFGSVPIVFYELKPVAVTLKPIAPP